MNGEFIMTGRANEDSKVLQLKRVTSQLINEKIKENYSSLYHEILGRKQKERNGLLYYHIV